MFANNKAHPWHGISYGDDAPDVVTVFLEIVPSDTVKYEADKETGYLKIDRPQQYSNVVPANYGFIPRTYCGQQIADLASAGANRTVASGDGDPLDILVLSEHHIPRGDIILKVFEQYHEMSDLPKGVIARFEHYFLTYKSLPGETNLCEIAFSYGCDEAHKVINAAIADYRDLIKAS